MGDDDLVDIQRAARLARSGRDRDALALIACLTEEGRPCRIKIFATRLLAMAQHGACAEDADASEALPAGVRVVAAGLCWWAEEVWLRREPVAAHRAGSRWPTALVAHARAQAYAENLEDAWRLLGEAVDCWRVAAAADARTNARLAESLRMSAVVGAQLGMEREALLLSAEACRLFRGCCDGEPLRYLGALASALHNVAGLRFLAGRADEAVPTARSSITLRREGAKFAPIVFLPDLALSLLESSRILANVELHDEACAYAEEAVALSRSLAIEADGKGHSLLVRGLRARSDAAMRAGAWTAGHEAVEAEIALLRAEPGNTLDRMNALADALHNRATFLTMLGRDMEASESVQESLNLRPEREADLKARSASLHMSGVLAARAKEHAHAVACFEQARSSYESAGDEAEIGQTCLALAEVHAEMGSLADALEAVQHAVDSLTFCTGRDNAAATVGIYARALVRLGDLRRMTREDDLALAAYRKAASLRQQLGVAGVSSGVAKLAVFKLIACLRRSGRYEEAAAWLQRLGGTGLH